MIHIGFVGGGGITDTHLRAAQEVRGVQVAGVFGDNRARASALAAKHQTRAFDSLAELFASRPLDAVAIGSPSGLHAEQGLAALRHGLHVITEKPIDVTMERALALVDEAGRRQRALGVFFQDRVQPDIQRLRTAIAGGAIGKPLQVTARVKWYRPPEYYTQSRWRGTWALDGGGALMNQGIHTVDLLLFLLGDLARVTALTRTVLHRVEVEDTALALLEFENGVVGTLEATTAAFPGYKRRVEISGTEGTVVLEHDRIVQSDLRAGASLVEGAAGDQNVSASSPVVSDVGGHRRLLEDFVRAIETGSTPVASGREALRSLRVVLGVYESAKQGRAVDV